jgi:hypothetical protein
MLTVILLTLLLGLTLLRYLLEPTCPCCSGKSWREEGPVLACRVCGWSNAAPLAPRRESAQYELIAGD